MLRAEAEDTLNGILKRLEFILQTASNEVCFMDYFYHEIQMKKDDQS